MDAFWSYGMDKFWLFGNLSVRVVQVTIVLAFLIYPLVKYVKRRWRLKGLKRPVSRLQLVTVGVYIALVLLFLPYCHDMENKWGDSHVYLRPIPVALYKAVRMFAMGVGLDDFLKLVPAEDTVSRAWFSLYTVALYFIAPMLTVGNALSLLDNLTGRLYLRLLCWQRIVVLSELNPRSVSLAESILNSDDPKVRQTQIVFCGVSGNKNPLRSQLQTKGIDAICLKKDICRIGFFRWGGQVDLFLIGENETVNTTLAIRLTEQRKKGNRKVAVHVFSSDPTTDQILDTLNMGDGLLSRKFDKLVKESAKDMLFHTGSKVDYKAMTGNFSIRSVSPVALLARDVLRSKDYEDFKQIRKAAEKTGSVSVTIVGMGRYGTQFLKTALWFYQRLGICVECNVFDLGNSENGDPGKRIRQECPELLEVNPSSRPGDACYDIRFFNTDCFSSDFDDILHHWQARMKKTNVVFIALGSDEEDIRAAVAVQTAFARMGAALQEDNPMPFIYAVVHDNEKAANLNAAQPEKPGAGVPVLRFVGTWKDCYDYSKVSMDADLEATAFNYHLEWAAKENRLRRCYEAAGDERSTREDLDLCRAFREKLDAELKQKGKELSWDDAFLYETADGKPDYNSIKTEAVKEQVELYLRKSYYRNSSIAKALHRESLQKGGVDYVCKKNGSPVCDCDSCVSSRITEHMRWNAYMRTVGYRYAPKKNAMAKLHYDLILWQDLPCRTQYKD